jgi:predicted nucleic acid-binding protein
VKISVALQSVQLLAIDASVFIYFVEKHPVYRERVRTILQLVDEASLKGYSSVVTLTEVLSQPIKLGRTELEQTYRRILMRGRNFRLVPVFAATAEAAADLRARYNLRTPDALQLATALETRCDAFLTNDHRLNRVTDLKILVLDDLELDTP